MKCPKCGYIGFEEADRCRNCSYEFALADVQPPAPELRMRAADDGGGPLADLALGERDEDVDLRGRVPSARRRLDLDRVIGAEPHTPDLPLFGGSDRAADDLPPLVSAPAAPRRPLAVRRQTPQATRVRRPQHDRREDGSTLELPLPRYVLPDRLSHAAVDVAGRTLADPVRRVLAALIDVVLLGGVHAVTMYFTLRLCGLTAQDWRVLPLLPMLAFFLIVDGGYLVAFTTAGGQTIGKMALGLKVVCEGSDGVSVGIAAGRALGAITSTLCLGAGLIPALIHEDRRAVHDRLAGTVVVRLPA